MKLPVTDINQSGDMISGTVWCTFQWAKPEHGRGRETEQDGTEWGGETAWVGHWGHAHRTRWIKKQKKQEVVEQWHWALWTKQIIPMWEHAARDVDL